MYPVLLGVHNVLRWVVLIGAALALVTAYRGFIGKQEWKDGDRKFGAIFVGLLDLEVLVGLVLYLGVSPLTRMAFQNFSAAMHDPTPHHPLRFFAVEHIVMMIVAALVGHAGNVMLKRAPAADRYRIAAISYTVATLIILAGIPWWRPLVPGLH